jgi:pantothenate kinase type III
MIGIIDIGNTTNHCGLFENGSLVKELRTNKPWEVKEFFDVTKRLLCISVVPERKKLLEEFIGFNMIPFPLEFIQLDYYSRPGEDRLANGLAAKQSVGLPVIVVDAGSAITVDLFSSPTDSKFMIKFEGGAIMPGINKYFSSVSSSGVLLAEVEPEFKEKPGKNTEDCIKFGAFGSLVGGIKEILRKLDYKNKNLIFTGGDGEIFSKYFKAHYDPTLTLYGGLIACNEICR